MSEHTEWCEHDCGTTDGENACVVYDREHNDAWTVRLRIDQIRAGHRFIFSPAFGGEGEVLTAAGAANNMLGTWVLGTEELDFDLEFYGYAFLTLAPENAEPNNNNREK